MHFAVYSSKLLVDDSCDCFCVFSLVFLKGRNEELTLAMSIRQIGKSLLGGKSAQRKCQAKKETEKDAISSVENLVSLGEKLIQSSPAF